MTSQGGSTTSGGSSAGGASAAGSSAAGSTSEGGAQAGGAGGDTTGAVGADPGQCVAHKRADVLGMGDDPCVAHDLNDPANKVHVEGTANGATFAFDCAFEVDANVNDDPWTWCVDDVERFSFTCGGDGKTITIELANSISTGDAPAPKVKADLGNKTYLDAASATTVSITEWDPCSHLAGTFTATFPMIPTDPLGNMFPGGEASGTFDIRFDYFDKKK